MRAFPLGFLSVLLVLYFYTAAKAMELWPAHRWGAALLAALYFLLAVAWQFLYRAFPSLVDAGWFRLLAWAGGFAMSVWISFVLLSLPWDLLRLAASGMGRIGHAAALDPERRDFLSRGVSLSLLGVSGLTSAFGLAEVLRGPRVKAVEIPFPGLPDAFYSLRIVQLSDLHVGPTISAGAVQEVVDAANALQPDLLFLTGDCADGTAESLARHLQPLAGLKARLGSFYVTGNHEYYWGAEGLIGKMRELGIQPLLNENRVLPVAGENLLIAGVTDSDAHRFLRGHRADFRKALVSDQGARLKILLAHRPEACQEAESLGADLQFSGHTHSGQFFPFRLLMPLAHKYYRGLHRHGRLSLYVNQGTGYWGPPNRFSLPQEISLITLCREAPAS